MSVFKADNSAFYYMGRIDFSEKTAPMLIYAGSNVRCRFKGTYLNVTLDNIPMGEKYFLGAIIDGVQYKIELSEGVGEKTYKIAENLGDEVHTLILFKRQAAAHYFRFISAETDGELLPIEDKFDLKLEFYGDSVTAGEVTEAIYYDEHQDPENHKGVYDNSYFSYSWIVSRKLNAEFYNNSQGGLALFDKTGYFNGDDLKGLETTYNKMSYVPYAPMGYSDWDFKVYTPDIVIFAIGQNDANPDPKAIFDREYAEKWKAKYKEIVLELKERYGNVKFLLLTTVLMHDPRWDEVIDEIKEELGDYVYRYHYRRNGAATPGHPRVTEQNEMALELEQYIKANML